jgi:1-deoxyxylulose-5-phosphate synthase
MQFIKFRSDWSDRLPSLPWHGDVRQADHESESFRVFEKAADTGVNFIDTADVYPGGADLAEVGRAEEITDRWLKDKRGRFILGTKAGGAWGPHLGIRARLASTSSMRLRHPCDA